MIIVFNTLSEALLDFVSDLAEVFTDWSVSGLPVLAKYKHLSTIWARTSKEFFLCLDGSCDRPRTELPPTGDTIHLSLLTRNISQPKFRHGLSCSTSDQ